MAFSIPPFLFVVFGLLVGSFLNVVIFRIEKRESFVGGRSKCLHCQHTLAWYDNIPLLSFLFLRGRCSYCKKRLSYQYPAVEFATALLFGVAGLIIHTYHPGLSQILVGLTLLAILSFAILITVYDVRYSLIPNSFLWGINITTFLFLATHWFFELGSVGLFPPSISESMLGALVAGAFFFFLVYISRETWMGWGDVWLGIWGGMLVGIELIQVFITLSFTLGACVGLTLLYKQKKTLKAEIPFAPYILTSGLIILVLLYWYPPVLRFLSPWLPVTIE